MPPTGLQPVNGYQYIHHTRNARRRSLPDLAITFSLIVFPPSKRGIRGAGHLPHAFNLVIS